MSRIHTIARVGYWMHVILTLITVGFLTYILTTDYEDEPALFTASLMVHGVMLFAFGRGVGQLRRFPEHRVTDMLDDLELGESEGNARVVGLRAGLKAFAVINLLGLFVFAMFCVFYLYQVMGYLRYLDEWRMFVLLGITGIGVFTSVFAIIFTASCFGLKVRMPIAPTDELET